MKQSYGLFAFALLEQPGLRVGGGGMGPVQAPLPMKVHLRVATGTTRRGRGVLGPEALQGSPGLNQGAVHGEMLVRQQSGLGCLLFDAPEKGGGQIRPEKALPVLGEDGMVPDLVVHGQAHKPAKQEIVIQLFHQQSLTANGVQHLEEQGPEQLLRGDGGASLPGVHGRKVPGELPQSLVHHLPQRPQRMVFGNPGFRGQVTEHGVLMDVVAPHNRCLQITYCYH